MADRRRQCGRPYAGNYRYACTLDLDHGGDQHEDQTTEYPSNVSWLRPELIDIAAREHELDLVNA
jgi:hypothetical protein